MRKKSINHAGTPPNITVRENKPLKDIHTILYYGLGYEYLSYVDSMCLLQLKNLLLKAPLNLARVAQIKYMQSVTEYYKKCVAIDSPLKKYLDQIERVLEIEAKAQDKLSKEKKQEEQKQEEKKLEPTPTQSDTTPTKPAHKPKKNQSTTLNKVTNDCKEVKQESQNKKYEEEKKPSSLTERLVQAKEKIFQCLPQQENKLTILLTIVQTINNAIYKPEVRNFSGNRCNLYYDPQQNIPVGFATILGYIGSVVSNIESNHPQDLSKIIDQHYNLVATLWTQKKKESEAQNEKIQSSCCFGGLYSLFYSRKQITRDVYTSLEIPTFAIKI